MHIHCKQETRMPSQALNRAMPHSRNQLEGVNCKEIIFYLGPSCLNVHRVSKKTVPVLFFE